MKKLLKRLFYFLNIDRCGNCLSDKIESKITDSIDYIVCEEIYFCKKCENIINYWAYGWFEYPYIENLWERLDFLDYSISQNNL